MPRLRFLFLVFACFAAPAHADDDGLSPSYQELPGATDESEPRAPREPEPEEEEAPPPVHYAPTPAPNPRFNLDERTRFRRWLTALCRKPAVRSVDAERLRYTHDRARSVSRATNKQGTLLLLLENYSELAAFRDDCEAQRKKDPEACLVKGRLPKPWEAKDKRYPWIAFGSSQFWQDVRMNRAPAGIEQKTDLLAASRARVKAIQSELKKHFFDLRDAADLDGKPGSGGKARSLVDAVRADSTCGTRAVRERVETPRPPK
jgi:hypothetical protein